MEELDSQPSFLREETAFTETLCAFEEDELPDAGSGHNVYVDTSRGGTQREPTEMDNGHALVAGEAAQFRSSPEKSRERVMLTEVPRRGMKIEDTPNFSPSDDSEVELSDEEIDHERRREYQERASKIESILQQEELWDTDLEDDAVPLRKPKAGEDEGSGLSKSELHDTTGKSQYRRACEKFGAVPASYFLQHIADKQLSMRYHGLGASGTKAVASALKNNISVEQLDLSSNWMDKEGALAIGRMIEDNSFVNYLALANNNLGDDGVQVICHAMRTNGIIRHLDISGNRITDVGADYMADMIENNKTLQELIASHNLIGSDGAMALSPAVASNEVLEVLDLSWNRIRSEGAVELAKGLKENVRIKTCRLGWNGFGTAGGEALADMLRENGTMIELDISGNRLDSEIATKLGKNVAINDCLQVLRLGFNPINTAGSISLISQIHNSDTTELLHLGLEGVSVEFEFIRTVESIKDRRANFTVSYGTELRVGNTTDDLKKDPVSFNRPIVLMREHVLIRDYRIVDKMAEMDESGRHCVTLEQFTSALDNLGVKYLRSQVKEIGEKLDKFGDGTIFFGDFLPPDGPVKEEILGFE